MSKNDLKVLILVLRVKEKCMKGKSKKSILISAYQIICISIDLLFLQTHDASVSREDRELL